MKSLQFELWHECNSRCKFCYLGPQNRCTPDQIKIKTLEKVYEKILDTTIFQEFDNLSYIGGEFFQGQLNNPEVKKLFMNIMSKTAEYLRNGTINSVWLSATLTLGDQKDLYETLDLFKDINRDENPSYGLWIIGSYDTIGRFHTQQMEDNWKYHIKNIHEKYPNVKINVCTILTGDLIGKYIKGDFTFGSFMKEYNCSMFIKQPAPGYYSELANNDLQLSKELCQKDIPNFFPQRKVFLEFLEKVAKQEPETFEKLFNVKFRADVLYRNFNDIDDSKHMVKMNRIKDSKMESDMPSDMVENRCGHMMQYAAYIDSDRCMICDRNQISEMLNNDRR